MASVNAKCTNCGENIVVDDTHDAAICPNCNQAFVTEKAIKLCDENVEKEKQVRRIRNRHILKSLGQGALLALECIGYLFYVLFFIWLFVDITDKLKKK